MAARAERCRSAKIKNNTGIRIEVLNVKVGVKKAIILLLHHTDIKVLKDALAC